MGYLFLKCSICVRYISVNNNTNFKFFCFLSFFIIWDGLSLKPSHTTVPLKTIAMSPIFNIYFFDILVVHRFIKHSSKHFSVLGFEFTDVFLIFKYGTYLMFKKV
jgi:hypothetical protein